MIAAARIVSRSHCDSRSSGARMWFGNSRNGRVWRYRGSGTRSYRCVS